MANHASSVVLPASSPGRTPAGLSNAGDVQTLRAAIDRLGRHLARRVEVAVFENTVQLRGNVSSYSEKQKAQQAILELATGLRIFNEITVDDRRH